jgi:hypothetical protein
MSPKFRRNLLLHVHVMATVTLKREAAHSKVKSTVTGNPTRLQNPEDYELVSTRCEGLHICRIRVGVLVYLSLVLSVCPSSIPSFNYGHQYSRYDFTQLDANIMKLETSPHQSAAILVFINRDMARQVCGSCSNSKPLLGVFKNFVSQSTDALKIDDILK